MAKTQCFPPKIVAKRTAEFLGRVKLINMKKITPPSMSKLLVILSLALLSKAFALESDLFEARTYKISSTVTMSYRLFKPKNYIASQKYPMVVCLHEIGERGSDNRIQVDREDLAHPWIDDSVQTRVPHFVMIPQCPANLYWWSSTSGTGPISVPTQGVVNLIDSLKREFSLDTTRLYITGLSMGGMGTWDLLRLKPNIFAAAVPASGLSDPTTASTIVKTPFWAHHGSTDGTVNVSGDRNMMLAIEALPKKVIRFVSVAPFTAPTLTSFSDSIKKNGNPLTLVAKNPSGISWDSVSRAVTGGSDFLYSEATNGDHRTGWMIAWHNPLLAKWLFSKTKVAGTTVSITPKLSASRDVRKTSLIFGNALPEGISGGWTLMGRSFDPRVGSRAATPILLVRPVR